MRFIDKYPFVIYVAAIVVATLLTALWYVARAEAG